MEIKYLNSAVPNLLKLNSIDPCSGLSNEILCILIPQEAEELLELKFGALKKWSFLPSFDPLDFFIC